MKTNTLWKSFIDSEQTLALSHTYKNGVYYHLILTINDATLSEHLKDICIQEIHPLLESLSDEYININTIEWLVEHSLQQVNHAFSLFAEGADRDDYIDINGALVISYQWNILVSLIGWSSLLICRNGKSIYNMTNTESNKKRTISHFTDYISGNIHNGDTILILWFDHSLILHNDELHKIAQLIYDNEPDMLQDLESMMTARTEEKNLWFMSLVRNISQTIDFSGINKSTKKVMNYLPKWAINKISGKTRDIWSQNSYTITLWILALFVIISIYSIINGALNKWANNPTITTENGVEVVTIDDIKKEINAFQELDATTSNEKWAKYKAINDKLEFLKSQGKWLDDVAALQKILQEKYYEWFNIIAINNLNDITGEFKSIYPFSENETKTLWSPLSLMYEKWFYIGWTKGAIIKWINQDVKWTPVSYSITNEMKKCNLDLSKTWLYCFDDKNELYRITAWSVTPFSLGLDISLPTDIQDIGTFGRNNIYLMINPQSNGGSDLIRRYTIQAGNFASLWTAIWYKYNGSGWAFTTMTIDGNFMSWSASDKKLYQFQRDPNTNNLNERIIELKWWDTTFVTYSDNVKIITSASSRYVYLFDKWSNTFTVYNSTPLKTTQGNETVYNLQYVMRYTFDKSVPIIDATVPDSSASQPILYVVTANWVFESNLWEAIKLYENKQ